MARTARSYRFRQEYSLICLDNSVSHTLTLRPAKQPKRPCFITRAKLNALKLLKQHSIWNHFFKLDFSDQIIGVGIIRTPAKTVQYQCLTLGRKTKTDFFFSNLAAGICCQQCETLPKSMKRYFLSRDTEKSQNKRLFLVRFLPDPAILRRYLAHTASSKCSSSSSSAAYNWGTKFTNYHQKAATPSSTTTSGTLATKSKHDSLTSVHSCIRQQKRLTDITVFVFLLTFAKYGKGRTSWCLNKRQNQL